jgi:hypothetical protein
VDVHIALHDYECSDASLRADDTPAKVLKMQGVISFRMSFPQFILP